MYDAIAKDELFAHLQRRRACKRLPAGQRELPARKVRLLLAQAEHLLAEAAEHQDGCLCELCGPVGPGHPRRLLGKLRQLLSMV